jgi:hypothetical protein
MSKEIHDVLFVWIKWNQFTFHLPVSLCTCGTAYSYHVNIKYHQWRTRFDGTTKNEEAPKHRDGKFVFEMIKNINVVSGKPVKGKKRKKNEKAPKDSPFKKQSIFFRYLSYWKEFEIGHAIDTMHVTNGVFESTIGLLLDIPSKTKDGHNARKDLQVLEIR